MKFEAVNRDLLAHYKHASKYNHQVHKYQCNNDKCNIKVIRRV